MTVHHDAGMRSPARSRRWTALGLAGLMRPIRAFILRRRLTLFAPLAVAPGVLLALLAEPGSAALAALSAHATPGRVGG